MQYWSAIDIAKQLAGEMGLTMGNTFVAADDVQGQQILAALNAAGNELNMIYPWEQFQKELTIQTVVGQGEYPLPSDWKYFLDQTQWDRTNRWPLLGPKSPAEWAWLKGGLLATFPRMRYRVAGNKFMIWPVPDSDSTTFNLAMEYVAGNWVQSTESMDQMPNAAMIKADGDIVWYDPWLALKFAKLKFYQLKGFDTTAAQADFLRVFESLKGKDTGAPVLSLVPIRTPFFIGPWSVPDGNWNV